MTDDFTDDRKRFRARFLAANANEEFIAERIRETILDLLRTISSADSSVRVDRALEHFVFALDLFAHREQDLSIDRILSLAVDEIKEILEQRDTCEDGALDAARAGMKYIAELASTDNAARGRASRRESSFRDACKYWLNGRDW